MKPELEKALIEKYPKIFQDVNKSMMETCMCWGIECGDGWFNLLDTLCSLIQWHIDQSIESNERDEQHNKMVLQARAGDLTLFNEENDYMDDESKVKYLESILKPDSIPLLDYGCGLRMVREPIPQVVADQVKEKYGGLRYYFHGGDDYIEGAVALAEAMGEIVCEVCGAPGKVCGAGWLRTVCEEHEKK